jgi:D-alanyl-D-alanine carboxypeptidase/D-alanyl-D-alanine endopeptidase (penicillin-binding protein 7)
MFSRCLQACIIATCLAVSTGHALPLRSEHAIVISDETGQVVMEKSADVIVPIASLTKLLTAMVVLDSKPDMEEKISIESEDVDVLKHSRSRVPVGTTLPRKKILELALMSSDNRAAAALGRTYPGGESALIRAIAAKARALGMINTVIKEPTGLSPENTSTAADLAKMALAASKYPQIVAITTDKEDAISLNGRSRTFHNTNRLVGATGWDVLLSKTGFTNEAGHCLIMRIKQAGRQATLVLLNANAGSSRMLDALRIRQYLAAHIPASAVPRYPTVVANR